LLLAEARFGVQFLDLQNISGLISSCFCASSVNIVVEV
jgi:hypothetical protein